MKSYFTIDNFDYFGFFASLTCAIHCVALPFLVGALPLMGLGFLANHWIEYSVIVMSLFLAIAALSHGFRSHHHKLLPLLLVVLGFGIILIGLVWGHGPEAHAVAPAGPFHLSEINSHSVEILHFITPIGALMVAFGHLVNWYYIKQSKNSCPDAGTAN